MPWRNGTGITHEIARDPPEPDVFRWRLSLAMVAHSGPFSAYPGYLRSVTLVDGAGFRLDVAGRPPAELQILGQSISFPGEAATVCSLFVGPSTDLSLMVRDPGSIVSVTTHRCDIERTYRLGLDAMQAFFCLTGTVHLSARSDEILLSPYDTALVGSDAPSFTVHAARSSAGVLVRLVWKPLAGR